MLWVVLQFYRSIRRRIGIGSEDGCGMYYLAGNGVTANMPGLGPGDSGFESRFPDLLFK